MRNEKVVYQQSWRLIVVLCCLSERDISLLNSKRTCHQYDFTFIIDIKIVISQNDVQMSVKMP